MNILKKIKEYKKDHDIDISQTTVIVWKEIDNIIKDDFKLFNDELNGRIEHSELHKEEFLKEEFNTKQEDHTFNLAEYYGRLFFFPTEPVFSKFAKLGLKKSDFKFFIPLNDIIESINEVNKSENVRIKYNSTIKLLANHYKFKIYNFLQLQQNKTGQKKSGTIYSEAHNKLFDYYRGQDYIEKVWSYGSEFSFFLSEILSQPEFFGGKDEVTRKKLLLNAQGKTEKEILKLILDECTFHKCSESELYVTLFGFFKLVMPDSALLSEDEFYANDFSTSYNGDYNRYKYLKLKSILKSTTF